MADDIIAKAREIPQGIGGYYHGIVQEMIAEIERLRAERVEARRDVETLKAELVRNADECRETLTELRQRVETLTAERDEARREVCAFSFDDPRRTAADRGWVGLLEPEDHAP